jgi:hypothetical protein
VLTVSQEENFVAFEISDNKRTLTIVDSSVGYAGVGAVYKYEPNYSESWEIPTAS